MTNLELEKARNEYYYQLAGKKEMLECMNSYLARKFALNLGIDKDKIEAITEDMILRNTFLSIFQNTKNSNNLMVYINHIQKTNNRIDDGQPELVSINRKTNNPPQELQLSILYCDLETNKPILINSENKEEIKDKTELLLPDYTPQIETYHYSSHSLEKISKGFATKKFDRLQLFYFRELLEHSREETVERIRKLSIEEMRKICQGK